MTSETAFVPNAPAGTAERVIQRLENANAGGFFHCEADREEAIEIVAEEISAALASTAGAGAWRPMNTAPSDTPIVARHKPNSRTPHGWVATISRAPEDPDERVGGLDTILHYNGNALMRGFHGVWVGWMYPEEFAALALSAGTLSVGWDGARDAFARIVEDRAWTAEHGEPRAACLRAASDIRQAKAPAVPASPRSGAGEGEAPGAAACRSAREKAVGQLQALHQLAGEATPPAPAEHGVEIRELRAAAVAVLGATDNPDALQSALGRLETVVRATPVSQGGGAGRSERAVEIRELHAALSKGHALLCESGPDRCWVKIGFGWLQDAQDAHGALARFIKAAAPAQSPSTSDAEG